MSEPIRVAQVVGKMVGGGLESVVMNYYRYINREIVQFDFVVDSDSTLVPADEIEGLGGRVLEVPPYQRQPSNIREMKKAFERMRWPIVHSHMNSLSVIPLRAAKLAGVPVRIAHSHSTWGKGEFKRNILKALLRTQSNRYSTHRLACSLDAGEWLFGHKGDFHILYNAIELEKFAFDQAKRTQIRNDLGVADNTFIIGHVGRFMPQKNHRFLIETFQELANLRSDCVLLLVGSGEGEASIKRLVNERGLTQRVIFLGQREDINMIYQAMDAFVLPSLYEGLGLVAIEAQRSGLPCFLSDTITRDVNVTGKVRFLAIDDAHSWAMRLERMQTGTRYEVSDVCFSDYDIRRQAPRLTEFYEEALRGAES